MKYYTTPQVAKMLNIHPTTLYGYIKLGYVTPKKLPTGRLRWTDDDIATLLNKLQLINDSENKDSSEPRVCLYARISQPAKEHLDNQLQVLKQFSAGKGYTISSIVTDIGSSFNFKRSGLRKILRMALKREFDILIVYSKDRLSRLAYEFFELLFTELGIKIEVVIEDDKPIEQWQLIDITEELIAFIHYISSKIYGSRAYKQKLKQLEQEVRNEFEKRV